MNSGWVVEHPCPQCGAPVQLNETDRVLSCGFCRVRHLLMAPGFFNFCLPPRIPRDDIFFIPYWHVRGMAFTCASSAVRFRVVDISRCASELDFAPPTLGLRPQAMKLRFAAADEKSFFVSRRGEAREMLLQADAWTTIDSLSKREQVFLRELIGETCSVIYAPFYYKDKTYYDAVLDRPVHRIPLDEKATDLKGKRDPGGQISFMPALCPQCGWDLEGEKESCVFICRNCESAWESVAGALKSVPFGIAETRESAVLHVPFWRMQARIDGISLENFCRPCPVCQPSQSCQARVRTATFKLLGAGIQDQAQPFCAPSAAADRSAARPCRKHPAEESQPLTGNPAEKRGR